jgi:hypothetical protein
VTYGPRADVFPVNFEVDGHYIVIYSNMGPGHRQADRSERPDPIPDFGRVFTFGTGVGPR